MGARGYKQGGLAVGFILLNTAFLLRVPYDKLGSLPNAAAAKALRERDWNMLNYLSCRSVDPQTYLAGKLREEYEKDPDKYNARARPLACWVCRPMGELISSVLGKDDVTTSTVNMAMDSLRRLERCHLLRMHGTRRNGKMPLTELLVIARAEEFGVPVPYPKTKKRGNMAASPTDLAGNEWDTGNDISTIWESDG